MSKAIAQNVDLKAAKPIVYSRERAGQGRIGFSVFLALLVHCILLLGIGFTQLQSQKENAYITVELSLSGDSYTREGSQSPAQGPDKQAQDLYLKDKHSAAKSITAPKKIVQQIEPAQDPPTRLRLQQPRSADFVEAFAKFQAEADSRRYEPQGLNRRRELNSQSTFSAPETAYLNAWRRKCERIGRNNYPPGFVQGELTMLVSILRDGGLADVKILRSSGQPKLDEAALKTVRQASPFQPFTVEMRKQYDRLDFTRTWKFSKRGNGIDF